MWSRKKIEDQIAEEEPEANSLGKAPVHNFRVMFRLRDHRKWPSLTHPPGRTPWSFMRNSLPIVSYVFGFLSLASRRNGLTVPLCSRLVRFMLGVFTLLAFRAIELIRILDCCRRFRGFVRYRARFGPDPKYPCGRARARPYPLTLSSAGARLIAVVYDCKP